MPVIKLNGSLDSLDSPQVSLSLFQNNMLTNTKILTHLKVLFFLQSIEKFHKNQWEKQDDLVIM